MLQLQVHANHATTSPKPPTRSRRSHANRLRSGASTPQTPQALIPDDVQSGVPWHPKRRVDLSINGKIWMLIENLIGQHRLDGRSLRSSLHRG